MLSKVPMIASKGGGKSGVLADVSIALHAYQGKTGEKV
jgi:hypothetical protein